VKAVAVLKSGALLGVGMANNLYTRTALNSPWVALPSNRSMIAAAALSDGSILGIQQGTNDLYMTRIN
jgi:hypothetical protein